MGTLIYTHYLIDKVNKINQIVVNRGELIASANNRKLITVILRCSLFTCLCNNKLQCSPTILLK